MPKAYTILAIVIAIFASNIIHGSKFTKEKHINSKTISFQELKDLNKTSKAWFYRENKNNVSKQPINRLIKFKNLPISKKTITLQELKDLNEHTKAWFYGDQEKNNFKQPKNSFKNKVETNTRKHSNLKSKSTQVLLQKAHLYNLLDGKSNFDTSRSTESFNSDISTIDLIKSQENSFWNNSFFIDTNASDKNGQSIKKLVNDYDALISFILTNFPDDISA